MKTDKRQPKGKHKSMFIPNQLLRGWRQAQEYTQEELATMLGISRSAYRRYENGTAMPTAYVLIQAAQILQVPPREMYESFENSNGYTSIEEYDFIDEESEVMC